MAKKNYRINMAPIPHDLDKILNFLQLITLNEAKNEGWELCFVRRVGLNIPVPVIRGYGSHSIGVIEEDGNFNGNPKIRIRNTFEVPNIICYANNN